MKHRMTNVQGGGQKVMKEILKSENVESNGLVLTMSK